MKTAPLCLSALLALSATALPAVSAAAETPSAVAAPAETEIKTLTADETWKPEMIAGNLRINLNGHRLTLTGDLKIPNGKLTLSSTGEGGAIVPGEGGTISGDPAKEIEIASGTTVAVPPELLFTKGSSATPLLTVGDNARIEVTLPEGTVWHSTNTLQGKTPLPAGEIPTAVLVKKGPGSLQFDRAKTNSPISLKDLTLEVDGGILIIGSVKSSDRRYDPIFQNSCVRVTKNAPATSQWTNVSWWKLSGTNTFDIARGISVDFDRTFVGTAEAKLVKTGLGTFSSQIQNGVDAEVLQGTLHAEAYVSFNKKIHVRRGATLVLSPEPSSTSSIKDRRKIPSSCNVRLDLGAIYKAGPGLVKNAPQTLLTTDLGGPTLTADDGAFLQYSHTAGHLPAVFLGVTQPAKLMVAPPQEPQDGTVLAKAAGNLLTLVLPYSCSQYGVKHTDGIYALCPKNAEEITLTKDETLDFGTEDPFRTHILADLGDGHTLTVKGSVSTPQLQLSGRGTLVLEQGASLKADTITVDGKSSEVTVPKEILLTAKADEAAPVVRIGSGSVLNVDVPDTSVWHLPGPVLGTETNAADGTLRKTGSGTLVLERRGSTAVLENAVLEVAGGTLFVGVRDKVCPLIRNATIRVASTVPEKTTWDDLAWLHMAGTCTLDIARGKTVEFTRTISGEPSAKLIKTGPGTFLSQFQENISAEVREGTLHAEAFDKFRDSISVCRGATLILSPEPSNSESSRKKIPSSCRVHLSTGAVYEAGLGQNKSGGTLSTDLGGPTLTADDGAVLSLGNPTPSFSAFTREGTVCVLSAGKTEGATVLKRLDKDGTVSAEEAKNFIVRDADFIVEADTANKQYKLKKLTVTPPAGGASAAATPILSEKIRETAAKNGTAEVKVTGTSGAKALSADDIEKALTVFSGIETADVRDSTATLAVGYNFGISGMTIEDKALKVTARVQKTDASAADLADGAIIRLTINGKTVEGVADKVKADLKDGEVTFSVPMTAVPSGAKITVEAVR